MAVIKQFTVKDATQVRQDFCRTIRNGLIQRGVADPNVSPGSDYYVLGTALGNELAVIGANGVIACDEQMPDTAVDNLPRIRAFLNLPDQSAAGSVGRVVLSASAATTVATGDQLTDDAGLVYQVTTGGLYAPGDEVPIEALSTGDETNHAEGDVLRWATAPAFADEKALVASGGLVNGAPEEDAEGLRQRIFARLQNAPSSGNPQHLIELAEEASGSVQKGFAYPVFLGPSTQSAAVVAAPTSTSKSRVVAAVRVSGLIEPYVQGNMPRGEYVQVTSVTDTPADVAFGLAIPSAPTASPPGAGGGWKDGTPWPAPNASTSWRCTVTSVASTTSFMVDALNAPTKGVTRIAWLSPFDWKLYQATVTDVQGSSGAYTITVDRPFVGIAVGCYVWPDSERAQAYVDSALAAFALLGPGEKTANTSALVRGFRHPPPSVGWSYAVGPSMLRALSDAGDEVLDVQFLHRTDGTQTLTGTANQMIPAVPAATTDAPRIYVPRHLGFYRLP